MSQFKSLLSQIRSLLVVDVDSMDPAYAVRHTSETESFCDMTSNQAIVYNEAIRPENAPLVQGAIRYVHTKDVDQAPDLFAQDVIDVLTVLLAKAVYPNLKGNVHAQTSPSAAYDTEKTIEHAKKLVALFEHHGIPKERVCIKIPTTPESMVACLYLSKIGIQTLATCLFSVPQAIAASQAGCLYIAPYFNELRVHFEPSVWTEYANPALEHPMSQIILSIIQVFKEISSKTLVMPASIVTVKEVIALTSLHPDHMTIAGPLLDQLAALPPVPPETFEQPVSTFKPPVEGVNYLDKQGIRLKEALMADHAASRKLIDALSIFDECEKKTVTFVKNFQV